MSRKAVIVIGSNSTRYIAGDALDPADTRLRKRAETRLFLHMENGLLQKEAIAYTADQIAGFVADSAAPVIGVYATSAVRDANNSGELSDAIMKACGLSITVLSGKEEAEASFLGAAGDQPAGVIDIGGGSTEFAIGRDRHISAAVSLQLGASRLFREHPISTAGDVQCALEAAAKIISALPEEITRHEGIRRFYSVGGTGTACVRLLSGLTIQQPVEGILLRRDDLMEKLLSIAAVPRESRARIPFFPAARADILPTGMAILIAAMDRLRISRIAVTERCNGDGLLLLDACKNIS